MDLAVRKAFQNHLDSFTVDHLKIFAKHLLLKRVPSKKADIITELSATELETILGYTSELDRSALSFAAYAPRGKLNIAQYTAQFGVNPYSSKSRYHSPVILDLFLHELHIIPELIPPLKLLLPQPAGAAIATLKNIEELGYTTEALTERNTQKDSWINIQTTLQLIDSKKISVSETTKRPSGSTMKELSKHLISGDWYSDGVYQNMQSFALPLLLTCAGFAKLSGSKLELTPKGKKILSGDQLSHETVEHLWSSWVKKGFIDELNRIPLIKGQSKPRTLTSPQERRVPIDDSLSDMPTNEWISIKEFGRYMVASGNKFEIAINPWNLYFCEQRYGSLGYDGYGGWNILQERYIKALFMEYAATLGLIDILYIAPEKAKRDWGDIWGLDDEEFISQYDGLLAFRVTALGAFVFGITSSYEPPVEQSVALLDIHNDGTITVCAGMKLPPADVLYLPKVAVQKSDNSWAFSWENVRKSIESGEPVESILQFFTNRIAKELPELITSTLEDCSQRSVQFTSEKSLVSFECSNDDLMTALREDSKAQKLCIVIDKRIVIFPDRESKFYSYVRELGFLIPSIR